MVVAVAKAYMRNTCLPRRSIQPNHRPGDRTDGLDIGLNAYIIIYISLRKIAVRMEIAADLVCVARRTGGICPQRGVGKVFTTVLAA